MSVTSTNSNSTPMTVTTVVSQFPPPPTSPIGTIGKPPAYVQAPPHVIGLTPMFSCCINTATVYYRVVNVKGTSVSFSIVIGGVTYTSWVCFAEYTEAQIADAIQATLPAGFTCSAVKDVHVAYIDVTVTIYAPVFSGSTYGGTTVSMTLIGGTDIYGATNFTNSLLAECDCRYGKYGADEYPDDRTFVLPVFASANSSENENDISPFLFSYPSNVNPITNGDFKLQKLSGSTWSDVATLNNNTYGTVYNNTFGYGGTACGKAYYYGFSVEWHKVLSGLGEGYYRFAQRGNFNKNIPYCSVSATFCLKTYDCNLASGTVKFIANYSGGSFGSVNKQGTVWQLCCNGSGRTGSTYTPLVWTDSIRFPAMLAWQMMEYQRDQIKYQTGIINKVRDEAVKSFTMKSDLLPKWFHDRFSTYGLMADKLYVYDYNMNNPDYNIKKFWVVADSAYNPKWVSSLRSAKVLDIKFKEGQQSIYRDRCC